MDDVAVRTTPERRLADLWARALALEGIAARVDPTENGWAVVVPADEAELAGGSLDDLDEEPADEAVPQPPRRWGRSGVGVVAAWALLAAHAFTGPSGATPAYERGAADAGRILDGEVWRSVTALALHADLAHAIANAAALLAFLTALAWRLGPGLSLALATGGGAAGNLLTALAMRDAHRSIGASTAVFAVLGTLAALGSLEPGRRRRVWVIVAASVALLGLLGTSEGSDLPAHLFGGLAGGLLGVGAARIWPEPPSGTIQAGWALATVAAIALAWTAALAA